MKKIIAFITSFLAFNIFFAVKTYAVCPVCTVAVVAGLGLSRYLGIDDTVSGVWVGGLTLSMSFWLIDWMEKKWQLKTKFKYTSAITLLLMFALVYVPMITMDIIGHPFNVILGIDKLLFGGFFGVAAFLLGMYGDKKVREIKGKQLFNFQKVVFPVTMLLITSLVFYFITR
jgi:hypothetical protein